MASSTPRFGRLGRILAGFVLLLFAALALAAGIVSGLGQDRLLEAATARLSESLGRRVTARKFGVSLPEGEFFIRGLQIGRDPLDIGPGPPLLAVDEIRGNLGWRFLALARLHFESLAVEGLSVWGRDEAAPVQPDPGTRGPALAPLLNRVSFSSDRISVTGATIGYRNPVTPWDVRVDEVTVAFGITAGSGVDGEIRSESGTIRLGEQPEFPLALATEFRARQDALHLDRLELRSEFLEVHLNGSVGLGDDAAGALRLSGSADAGALGRHLAAFDDLDTRGNPWVRFEAAAGLGENGLAVDGELVLPGGRLYGVPLRDWKVLLHWDPDRFEATASEGFVSGGAASLHVLQVQPAAANPAAVALSVDDASLSRTLEGIFGLPTTLRSRVALDADLRVPLADPGLATGTIEVAAEMPEAGSGDLPLGFDAAVVLDEEAVVVRRLVAEGAAFRGALEGRYLRSGNADFTVSGYAGEAAEVDSVQQEFWRAVFGEDPETTAWDVSGACRFEGTVRGPWPDVVIAGTVEGQGLRFSAFHTETLVAAAQITPAAIRLESLSARAGEGTLAASGVFDRGNAEFPDLELDAEWDRWDIREIVDFLEWDLEAESIVSGRSSTVRRDERFYGGGTVLGSAGTFLEQPFDELSITWSLDGESVRLAPLTAAFREGSAEGALAIDLVEWTMEGAIIGRDYPLAPGLGLEGISMRSDFRVDVGGDLPVPELHLEGSIPGLAVLEVPLGPAGIAASVVGERFEASGALDSGTASFEIAGTLESDAAGAFTLHELDVASFLVDSPAEREISAVVNGTGEFGFDDPADEWMTGEAVLESLRIATPEFVAESDGPTRILMEDGAVQLERFRLVHSDGELEGAGFIDLDEERLDLTLRGRSSLRAAEPFVSGLTADGELALEIAVGGAPAEPEVVGTAAIRNGSFRVAGFPHALTELDGSVTFDQRSVRLTELSGGLASGRVGVSGEVLIDGVELGASDVRVRLEGARIRYPPDFSATVDADLRVIGDQGGRMLSGQVLVDDAAWSRDYELSANMLAPADTIIVPEAAAPDNDLQDLLLDVRVETVSPFAVRNSIVNLDADAAFGLQGSAASPAVVGRADLVEGELYVGAHRFDIVSGRAEFIDPTSIDPVFDVAAEASIRNYRVRLTASGTADEIEANVSSEPPLRQADILQLLGGAPEENLLRAPTDDPAGAVSATNLLSQQFSGMIGRRVGRVFGIDRVTVDPFMIGRFSNPTARVTLSKQVTPNLNVRYSSSLADADQAVVVVEYVRRRVTWILSRDEHGSLGLDFRLRRSY